MKKTYLTCLFVLSGFLLFAQAEKEVTLELCFQKAVENYPNRAQISLNSKAYDLNIRNIKTNYYPKLTLNGQVSYQSDVTKVPLPDIPGLEPVIIDKDWYKINLDVSQMIYDGGVTSGQKDLEAAKHMIANQKVQVELYKLKDRVNHLYFNTLFLRKNIEILDVLKKNLEAGIKEAETAFENGMVLSSDVDALRVEYYRAGQKILEKKEDISALLDAINELTGLNIQSAGEFRIPEITIDDFTFVNNRPEYILLGQQQKQVAAMQLLATVKRRPVFSAFGQAGYGRPGYDFLNNSFDDYYMVGLRLYWNIWDWGKVKREREVFDIQNAIINTRKETFTQNLRADLYQRTANITKYEKLIQTDEIIVRLQKNVQETSDAQLKNGTITSTTYLIELNKLVNARLNLEAHKLQLVYAKYQYVTAIGNL
ncbi:MAG: TolC family protein [Bacteroidales bacterium]|nr:TolC family protein [Bacteroidales bacterium]